MKLAMMKNTVLYRTCMEGGVDLRRTACNLARTHYPDPGGKRHNFLDIKDILAFIAACLEERR